MVDMVHRIPDHDGIRRFCVQRGNADGLLD